MPDPFQPDITLAARAAVSAGMGIAGAVVGIGGSLQLELPWPFAALIGLVVGALGAAIAWQKPELFFKNRK